MIPTPQRRTSQPRVTITTANSRTALAFAVASFMGLGGLAAADWPQFRGTDRTGISPETGLQLEWPASGPEVLWRRVSGEGFSGISVVGDRLYTQLGLNDSEYLFAIDAKTGKDIWRVKLDQKYENNFGNGPRSTPTVEEGVIYAISAQGQLVAANASDGKTLWQKSLRSEFKAKVPTWGISTSVAIEGDVLLLDVGGVHSLIGLNKKTGDQLWGALNDIAGYSVPIIETIAGKRQAVFFTGSQVASVDPQTGKTYWTYPWKTQYDVNAATPIFLPPNRVFISSGYGSGGSVLEIGFHDDQAKVTEVWSSNRIKNQYSSSIYFEGHLYGFDDQILKCIDAATGEERWKARGYGHGSLTLVQSHLIVLGERGRLGVVKASPKKFIEGTTVQALDAKSWTVPTVANGTLYLRNEKEIIAYKLSN